MLLKLRVIMVCTVIYKIYVITVIMQTTNHGNPLIL